MQVDSVVGCVTVAPSSSSSSSREQIAEIERVRVKKKTLQAVLDQCQRALELLSTEADVADDVAEEEEEEEEEEVLDNDEQPSSPPDREADQLCELLKSKFECPDFLKKLEHSQMCVPQTINAEGNSWDMVNEKDLWEAESSDCEQDDYVHVKQEDIVDGIACFMAAYLLSLNQTKDLNPNQLKEVLGKTFSMRKRKGKLRKAWEGSKVIYSVASWGATAIGAAELLAGKIDWQKSSEFRAAELLAGMIDWQKPNVQRTCKEEECHPLCCQVYLSLLALS
ncbi:hypothetical protein ACFE04_025487 [Oxalis oulophora]